jgi:hypothetical protein
MFWLPELDQVAMVAEYPDEFNLFELITAREINRVHVGLTDPVAAWVTIPRGSLVPPATLVNCKSLPIIAGRCESARHSSGLCCIVRFGRTAARRLETEHGGGHS